MKLRSAALIMLAGALVLSGAAVADYNTLNYQVEGGALWVVNGEQDIGASGTFDVKSGGKLEVNDVDETANVAASVTNPVNGVAAGYKVARGVSAVTGTLDLTTGLTTVVACSASFQEDITLAGNSVSVTIQTQTGGTAGHVTLKAWKPTATGDVTPIAATVAKNIGWVCAGT